MSKKKNNDIYINLAYFSLAISISAFAITANDFIDNANTTFIISESTSSDNDLEVNNKEIYLHTQEVIDKDEKCDYSGMELSHEYEDYIRSLCEKYAKIYDLDAEKLYQIVLTIGDQESNGTWQTNGIISKTNDYGQFQINEINHKVIEEELGITPEELLNDPYKNAEAAVWLIANIMTNEYCNKDEDIYGMYNGWINWESKQSAIKYVDNCLARNDQYFASGKLTKRK